MEWMKSLLGGYSATLIMDEESAWWLQRHSHNAYRKQWVKQSEKDEVHELWVEPGTVPLPGSLRFISLIIMGMYSCHCHYHSLMQTSSNVKYFLPLFGFGCEVFAIIINFMIRNEQQSVKR